MEAAYAASLLHSPRHPHRPARLLESARRGRRRGGDVRAVFRSGDRRRRLWRALGDARNATDIVAALGGLKGPLMKIAQLAATIPDLLPPEFAAELQKLQ